MRWLFLFKLSLLISIQKTFVLADLGHSEQTSGNGCPESAPWPCKSPNHCLSFDFICDGDVDCPDGYDEDENMCTAKDRPAVEVLRPFIEKYSNWLIPAFLSETSVEELAKGMIESKTLEDYAQRVHLSDAQKTSLKHLLLAIQHGRQTQLMLMGMPPEAWNEAYNLFRRIVNSGFLN